MKNPILQFLLWALFLSYPAYGQQAIQIEIDSAPVEVEIQQPAPPSEPATPANQEPEAVGEQTAETSEPSDTEEKTADSGLSGGQKAGIAIGAVVAAGLALLAGGGGGGGGGSATNH